MTRTSDSGRWSRRDLLRAGGVVLALGGTTTACSFLSTEPEDKTSSGKSKENQKPDAKEAPDLAAMVESGELPPLAERLPDAPMVVKPVERPGEYGGIWRTPLLGPADTPWLQRTIGYEHLMRWDVDFTEPIPNLAEAIDVEDDGRVFVIHLRAGTKWSDGEPFTADDVMFAYDEVLLNPDLYPTPPSWLVVGDEPAVFEKIDDTTVRVEFTRPRAFFLHELATTAGEPLTGMPRHYLTQFHIDHEPKADELAAEDGLEGWADLFNAKKARWENAELPTLCGWQATSGIGDGQQVIAERNPYYWKVDTEGRQLPYIDRVVFDLVDDDEVLLLRVTGGEVDMSTRHFNTVANKPVVAESRETGDYRMFEMITAWSNFMAFAFNLTHEDPVKREIFTNKDFRIGLSHAINREELIQAIYAGQGEPFQVGPRPESDYYDEELGKQFTEYDVDLAEEYLDRAGYAERDGDGYRLGPDGKPIAFDISVPIGFPGSPTPEDVEFVKDYWQAVGIDARVQALDRTLYTEREAANKHDVAVTLGAQAMGDAILNPVPYFPAGAGGMGRGAVPWVNWYSGSPGPSEEPPAAPKRQMELYDQLLETMDEAERTDLFRQILEITREEFYMIGTILPIGSYGIAKNNFHNVYEPIIEASQAVSPGQSMPEQYFISQDEASAK